MKLEMRAVYISGDGFEFLSETECKDHERKTGLRELFDSVGIDFNYTSADLVIEVLMSNKHKVAGLFEDLVDRSDS